MKNKLIIVLIALVCFTAIAEARYQKYEHKTGMISYDLTGKTKGTRTMYWSEYGYKELTVEQSETKIFGMKTKVHSYTLMLGSDVYTWDMIENTDKVNKASNPLAKKWDREGLNTKEVDRTSHEMMKDLGFRRTGEKETILGKKCESWETTGAVTWVWKIYSLKSEVNMLGMKFLILANDMKLNIDIPASKFDYPKDRTLIDGDKEMEKHADEEGGAEAIEMKKALEGFFGN